MKKIYAYASSPGSTAVLKTGRLIGQLRQESQEGREEKLKSFKAVEELKNSGQNGVFCEANRRI